MTITNNNPNTNSNNTNHTNHTDHEHLRRHDNNWVDYLHYSVYKSELLVNVKPDNQEKHIILLCKNGGQYFEVAFNEQNRRNKINGVRLGVIDNFDTVGKDIIDFLKYTFNEEGICYKIIDGPEDGVDLRTFFDDGYLQEWLHEEPTSILDHKDLPKLLGYTYDNTKNHYFVPHNDSNIEMYFFGNSYVDTRGISYTGSDNGRWKDHNGNSMTHGKGVHEIHLNSYGNHQDGCVIIHDKIKQTWKLVATVFVCKNKLDGID